MKKPSITVTVILLLLMLDIALLVMNRKVHKDMGQGDSVTAAERRPSMEEVTKSVKKQLKKLHEADEGNASAAGRRQVRRKIREERAYTLMALEALRMRIVKEARQKALQGRKACVPFMMRANGCNQALQGMVREERHKMAARMVKLNTPGFRARTAEFEERTRQKREKVYNFIHDLDTSRFDDATAKAHADYLAALDGLRALYDDPSASREAKVSAISNADSLAEKFGSLFKSNYLEQGFNEEKQKNELYVSALYDLLCRVRLQAEINRSGFTPQPEDRSGDSDRPALPENMIRHEP